MGVRMRKKYLLPALKKDVEVDSKECWESIEKVYDFLINNLLLYYEPNVSVFEGGSNAMPHMFEQMLLFHKAFFDSKDPEHDRAVAEWRAVLSMMALQRICNVKLDLVLVDLSGENNSPFLKAAFTFRPEDAPVFFNSTWEFLYVVRLKGIPVAIFSPITLVCPSKLFLMKVNENLDNRWLNILRSGNREELLFDLPGEMHEMAELYKWLKMLEGNLRCSGINGRCEDKFKKVTEEIRLFAEECGKITQDNGENPLRKKVYSSMNNNIRKEFDFLNICCEVNVKNSKLYFLIERYMEDVFENKLLLLVHDEAPDTMEREENVYKLEKMYRNILSIGGGKPIIEVYNSGGKRMAACVFLPFKGSFVSELILHSITPNEFFGFFAATYYSVSRQIEVTLNIIGFPYTFRKKYAMDDWQFLYGGDLKATYIWPTVQVDAPGWKNYYIYTEEIKDKETEETKGAGVEVSVPEAVRQVKYYNKLYHSSNNEFQLCKSHSFPAYLQYTYKGVSGFLPIRTRHIGSEEVGAVADIIIDLGHSTTSIAIWKEFGRDERQDLRNEGHDISFCTPRSERIVGNWDDIKNVNMNFVIPEEEKTAITRRCIKNMMHSFHDYDKVPVISKERKPFEEGQILFDSSAYLNELRQSIISYINFEYPKMDQIQREKTHIFIEQLLVYAVYQVILRDCSYVRLYFLHGYEDGDTRLGEVKGLWKNALTNVKLRTGINSVGTEDIIAIKEYMALSCYVYKQVYRERTETGSVQEGCINVGVNIGWKNTNVVILSADEENSRIKKEKKESKKTETDTREEDKEKNCEDGAEPTAIEGGQEDTANLTKADRSRVIAGYAAFEYAGRNISMMVDTAEDKLNLPVYPMLLKILLGGLNLDHKPDVQKMLEEFSELFDNKKKDITHYQGVFDIIAMKIDEAGYRISSDVFNNMLEFRYYLMAVTYNVMLLFLNVGLLLRKYGCNAATRINIFLGGNGAKFLKWISHNKEMGEIVRTDAHETFILQLENGIIEYIAAAAGINVAGTEIKIFLAEKPEEQLIEGSRIMKLDKDIELPEFVSRPLDTELSSSNFTEFLRTMGRMRQEVFREFPQLKQMDSVVEAGALSGVFATDLIENERKEMDSQVVNQITYINSKQFDK